MSAYIQSYINTGQGEEPARNFPVYITDSISIITGYYRADSSLVDVSTQATIEVINAPASNAWRVDPNNSNYFSLLQVGAYTFEVTYTDNTLEPVTTFTDYISLVVIYPVELPTPTDIYNQIKRSEPQGVYTQLQTSTDEQGNPIIANDYSDATATAAVFSNIYNDVNTVYQNLLPWGGNINWELTLNNTDGLLTNQPYSDIILEMLYSLLGTNTGNKFDVSFFLSKYIWYRSNKTIPAYVYIEEVTADNFVFWFLGISRLGVDTFLNGQSLTPSQVKVYILPQNFATISPSLQLEINNLIPRMLPFGYTYLTDYTSTLADLGLTINIGQTYKTDPRLGSFAIEYVSTNVNQAQAYVNPYAPSNIISLQMFPPSGTNFEARNYYPYSIIATYVGGFTKDITNETSVFSSNTSVLVVNALGSLYAVGNGMAILKFSFGFKFGTNTYTVTSLASWVLDKSQLDYTTILTGVPAPSWVLNSGVFDSSTVLT